MNFAVFSVIFFVIYTIIYIYQDSKTWEPWDIETPRSGEIGRSDDTPMTNVDIAHAAMFMNIEE